MVREVMVLECSRDPPQVEVSLSRFRLGACSMLPHRLDPVSEDGNRMRLVRCASSQKPGAM